MKKVFYFLSLIAILTGCDAGYDAREKEAMKQEELSKMAIESVGLPNISNFYEKKTLKKILEMRDDPKIINYLYTRNTMTGKWVYEGKCIGFGIPYTTQYTNPEVKVYDSAGNVTLPQADPNGLYSVPNGTATWVIKVGENGSHTVEYIESEIRVTQQKLDKRLVESWSLTENY